MNKITVAEYREFVVGGFAELAKARSRTFAMILRMAHLGYHLPAGKVADIFRAEAPAFGIKGSTAGVYASQARGILTALKVGREDFDAVLTALVDNGLVQLIPAEVGAHDYVTYTDDGKVDGHWWINGSLGGIYKKLCGGTRDKSAESAESAESGDATGAAGDGERGKELLIDVMLGNLAHLTRDELIQLASAIDVRLAKLNAAETVQVAAAA